MNRVNLESAIICAYNYSSDREYVIDEYLDEKDIDEQQFIESCLQQLTEKQVKELFIKIFN